MRVFWKNSKVRYWQKKRFIVRREEKVSATRSSIAIVKRFIPKKKSTGVTGSLLVRIWQSYVVLENHSGLVVELQGWEKMFDDIFTVSITGVRRTRDDGNSRAMQSIVRVKS